MSEDGKINLWMEQVAKSSGKRIEESHIYMSLVTDGYKEDPKCALELGIALLLDKPIALMVCKGTQVPENLKKVAKAIEYFDPDDRDDVRRASQELVSKMRVEQND